MVPGLLTESGHRSFGEDMGMNEVSRYMDLIINVASFPRRGVIEWK